MQLLITKSEHQIFKHRNSQVEGGRRILSPDEVKRLGIPTDPVLVISPVPSTPSKGSQNTKEPKSTRPASKTSPPNLYRMTYS